MGNGGSTEHYYHTNTVYAIPEETKVELETSRVKIAEFEAEAIAQGDPVLYESNTNKLLDNLVDKLPNLKLTSAINKLPGDIHIGVLGNISSGKTSLLNTMLGINEPVALDHCTTECKVVYSKSNGVGITYYWDVAGSNKDCKFYNPQSLSFIIGLDKAVIVYDNDPMMVSDIIRVVAAINQNIVLVRTKCDQHTSRNARSVLEVKESDDAKIAQYATGYDLYAVSSHNIDNYSSDIYDWAELSAALL